MLIVEYRRRVFTSLEPWILRLVLDYICERQATTDRMWIEMARGVADSDSRVDFTDECLLVQSRNCIYEGYESEKTGSKSSL